MPAAAIVFWISWGLILYTYIGFPLLLSVLARLLGRREPVAPSAEPQTLPRVAMVVSAYNEAHVIADKLRNTWQIDYPADRLELFVGSDGSSDGTNAILQECDDPRLRAYLFNERRGKISVLNSLMREVDADIVVMSDANTMYAPNALKKLVAHFEDPRVGCVSGELTLDQAGGVSGEGLYWKYEGWIKRNESRLGFLIGCNGGIFAIRRHLYEELPRSTIVEDFVLSMRVLEKGSQIRFEPEARATEPPCSSSRAEMIRKVRIGAGGYQALSLTRVLLHPRHGLRAFAYWGHKVLRWNVPFFLAAATASNLALLTAPAYSALFALQAIGWLIGIWSYRSSAQTAPPRWTRPISYFYLMNYALLCGFWRYLTGTQRVTWDRAPAGAAALASDAAAAVWRAATHPTAVPLREENCGREEAATSGRGTQDCAALRD